MPPSSLLGLQSLNIVGPDVLMSCFSDSFWVRLKTFWMTHHPAYGSESRITYRHHRQLLERFHQRCLRTILNIHWSWGRWSGRNHQHRVYVAEVTATLSSTYLQNSGYHLPKIAQYGELSTGHFDRGAPKKLYKDSLKKIIGTCHTDYHKWTTLAADRHAWRHIVH